MNIINTRIRGVSIGLAITTLIVMVSQIINHKGYLLLSHSIEAGTFVAVLALLYAVYSAVQNQEFHRRLFNRSERNTLYRYKLNSLRKQIDTLYLLGEPEQDLKILKQLKDTKVDYLDTLKSFVSEFGDQELVKELFSELNE